MLGRVVELWRYPVKSMQGESLQSCLLDPRGIPGDRGWALREKAGGKLGSAKRLPPLMLCAAAYLSEPGRGPLPPARIVLPDATRARTDSKEAEELLSRHVGRPMVLEAAPGEHFDDYPIHLLATASLDALSRARPASRFEARRFRPNILIETAAGKHRFPEIYWVGTTLRVGEALLCIRKPTTRCVMTTQAQPGLARDLGILRAVTAEAGNDLGVYASVLSGGRVSVGERVELVGQA